MRSKVLKTSASELMTRSLDPSLLDCCSRSDGDIITQSLHCPAALMSQSVHCPPTAAPLPLPAATQLVPVPESLVSPSVPAVPLVPKLQMIRSRAQEKRERKVDSGKCKCLFVIIVQTRFPKGRKFLLRH